MQLDNFVFVKLGVLAGCIYVYMEDDRRNIITFPWRLAEYEINITRHYFWVFRQANTSLMFLVWNKSSGADGLSYCYLNKSVWRLENVKQFSLSIRSKINNILLW